MVDRKGARRIRIDHVHNPQTPEQRQAEFDRAVENVTSSSLSVREQQIRIKNLRKAHRMGLAPAEDIFTANCPK